VAKERKTRSLLFLCPAQPPLTAAVARTCLDNRLAAGPKLTATYIEFLTSTIRKEHAIPAVATKTISRSEVTRNAQARFIGTQPRLTCLYTSVERSLHRYAALIYQKSSHVLL
jgi:hypothetical protein